MYFYLASRLQPFFALLRRQLTERLGGTGYYLANIPLNKLSRRSQKDPSLLTLPACLLALLVECLLCKFHSEVCDRKLDFPFFYSLKQLIKTQIAIRTKYSSVPIAV